MVRGLKPWLWLPPHLSYKLAHNFLPVISSIATEKDASWSPFEWKGLRFPSRLGLAGGVDKDATQVLSWWKLGAGFLELGTVTPKPQPGHQGKVIDRLPSKKAVWNRLGFPGHGALAFKQRLECLPAQRRTPLFINIGKNAATPLDQAQSDYLFCIEHLSPLADSFVVNISSPNTQGLRALLQPTQFESFIGPIKDAVDKNKKPLLVKLSPDLEENETKTILQIGQKLAIDGWVLTNTSLGVRDHLPFPKEGGVSGSPLAELSKQMLKWCVEELGQPKPSRPLLISVGGILSEQDVVERLSMGADLLQVYSALIFEGPLFFRRIARSLQNQSLLELRQ